MIYLKENMKFLRKQKGMTQGDLADKLDVKRSLIGSYEEGRGVPKLTVIRQMAELFGVSMDNLLAVNIAENGEWKTENGDRRRETENRLKVLSVVVTPNNEELISIVPVKASAGYLNGRADTEYMERLPNFSMPVAELSKGRSYRVFQIKGDSMLPVPPGSYIFCDYVEHVSGVREGKPYIIITADEGIVYKRVYIPDEQHLLLKSDNPEYEPYLVNSDSVLEIWKALGFLAFELPEADALNVQKLTGAVARLQEEVSKLKS
ncbi:MAG TPA: helix-turn-helix domain-containing protein [Prolixibacteraceae bacterium]|nr:helix-turn-helix domain-containing protein [Prolixibacteraceae bacterium]